MYINLLADMYSWFIIHVVRTLYKSLTYIQWLIAKNVPVPTRYIPKDLWYMFNVQTWFPKVYLTYEQKDPHIHEIKLMFSVYWYFHRDHMYNTFTCTTSVHVCVIYSMCKLTFYLDFFPDVSHYSWVLRCLQEICRHNVWFCWQ